VPTRIVLLRPRNADNLGAIARAMKNFGLSDWVVVSPNPQLLEVPGMNRLAVKAGELLESVRRVETLAEAVADCTWVVGTTMRRIDGRRRLTPKQVAERAASESLALVFGDERSGLTNEDLAQCHDLSAIPTSDEQPSLNLAQAVLIVAYELRLAADREAPAPPFPNSPADAAQLEALFAATERALWAIEFFKSGQSESIMRVLRSLIHRAEPDAREAALLRAIALETLSFLRRKGIKPSQGQDDKMTR